MNDRQKRKQAENRGRRAETIAAIWLALKRYKIVARRYKTKSGEIDLIARKGQMVIFIEVKARRDADSAEKSLFPQMQNRIENASEIYLSRTPFAQNLTVRYDAIFVVPGFLGLPKLIHKKNAWQAW